MHFERGILYFGEEIASSSRNFGTPRNDKLVRSLMKINIKRDL